jgi:uncharacterized membrane protein YesL
MGGFLSIDGPAYRFCNIIYYLILTNIMWAIFCLPVFTAGASTTAVFYVMGKVARGEDVSVVKDFWKSFKMNFKQGCIVGIILTVIYALLYFNLHHLDIFGVGLVRGIFIILQLGIAIPLVIVTVYAFPILARVHIGTKKLFISSIYIGSRHFIITIETLIIFIGMIFALRYIRYVNGAVFFTFGALYAYGASFILQNTINLYITPEPTEVTADEGDLIEDLTDCETDIEMETEINTNKEDKEAAKEEFKE